MARITLCRFCVLAVAAGMLPGASTITGPVAGYAVESSGPELRAIYGVPGSYRFSDPLPLPDGVTRIHMAPGQDFALVERGNAGLGILFLSGGTVDRVAAVDGALAAVDWVAFSPAAGSAVLFSLSANRMQVLSGLPDTPRVTMDLDASTLPELPLTGAVSDDGQMLLVASGQALYLVPPDGAAQLLLSAGEIVSVVMLRNGTDAAVSERSTGSVHILQGIGSAPVDRLLASGLAGIGKLYPASNGKAIFAARPGAKAMSLIDLVSGDIQSFDLDVAPVMLYPLRNRDTFLISARPHQPGWIFFRDGDAGHVVFIPGAKAAAKDLN
jgi:hypothetical protein